MSARRLVHYAIAVLCAGATVRADSLPLGDASAYNVFTLRGQSLTGTTIGGRTYAGGNVAYDSTYNGQDLAPSDGRRTDLVIGGDFTARVSSALRGNAQYAGSANLQAFQTPHGSTSRAPTGVNTSAVGQYLREAGVQWSHLSSTGRTTVLPWGTVILGGQSSGLNVFSLNASELTAARALQIRVPENATVLINVRGGSTVMQNLTFDLAGLLASHVMLNFVDAASVTIRSMLVQGTVFAPNSDVALDKGQVFGQVVAMTLSGTGRIFDDRFKGTLPPVTLVPLPATVGMAGAGLLVALGVRRAIRRA